jgi:hypothetical protein
LQFESIKEYEGQDIRLEIKKVETIFRIFAPVKDRQDRLLEVGNDIKINLTK